MGEVDFTLHPIEIRVLGSLLEKDVTTPEYYPLTMNALVNACNQKSNRDPVVSYDEETVARAVESLRAQGFLSMVTGGSNRVTKYAHRFSDRLNMGRREHAILCELLLRGPQTLGELRGRASRMYAFSGTDEVEACMRGLMEAQPEPLAMRLPHLPGTKEPRYAHLLGGEPEVASPHAGGHVPERSPAADRMATLEADVAGLREEVASLKAQMEQFQKQFE